MMNFGDLIATSFAKELFDIMMPVFSAGLILVFAYVVFLGFRLGAADDEAKRRSAKKRMVNALASMAIIGFLCLVLVTVNFMGNFNPNPVPDDGGEGGTMLLTIDNETTTYCAVGTYTLGVMLNGQKITNPTFEEKDYDGAKVAKSGSNYTLNVTAGDKIIEIKCEATVSSGNKTATFKVTTTTIKYEIAIKESATGADVEKFVKDVTYSLELWGTTKITTGQGFTGDGGVSGQNFTPSQGGKTYKIVATLNGKEVADKSVFVDELDGSAFQMPLKGNIIVVSLFGPRDNAGVDMQAHNGVDLQVSGQLFAPVYAAMNGTVHAVRYNGTAGNEVVIEHTIQGNKYYSFYMHMSKEGNPSTDWQYSGNNNTFVKVGDKVTVGGQIGIVGGTGNGSMTYSPHLHFEIRNTASALSGITNGIFGANVNYAINPIKEANMGKNSSGVRIYSNVGAAYHTVDAGYFNATFDYYREVTEFFTPITSGYTLNPAEFGPGKKYQPASGVPPVGKVTTGTR